MVYDQLDSDFEYQLLNDAKDEIESSDTWEILKRTTSFTGTSLTIPTRMSTLLRISLQNNYTTYNSIPIENKDAYVNQAYFYYIDFENNLIQLTESSSPQTKNVFYTVGSADIDSGTTWSFPARFHQAIPLKMAELYYAVDAGEKSRAWDDRWTAHFDTIMSKMEIWNDSLKTRNRRIIRIGTNPKGIDQ